VDRRTLFKGLGVGAGALAGLPLARTVAEHEGTPSMQDVAATVHTYQAGPSGFYVNAYLVETASGLVAVDATLTVSDSTALRAKIDAVAKPLLAVLITHPHPDHYAGVTALLAGTEVPVVSTVAVDTIIRRDDAAKDTLVGGLLGPEWPAVRTFPNTTLEDGASITFDGVEFTVRDTGPGESGADAYWTVSALPEVVFAGDLFYPHMDSYNADGFSGQWLTKLEQLEHDLSDASVLYPGHGGATNRAILAWQRSYLQFLRETVRSLANGQPTLTDDQKAEAKRHLDEFLPDTRLEFFVDVSLGVVAAELAASA
jgi:glyoxylase-like metal-dependent hydrolase (beta-lactamase superfamily II)